MKRPLGEVLNFPITIQGVTIPADIVVVTDAQSYSVIVGNDWLSKVKALIDYQNSVMMITWQGQDFEIPVEYTEMPLERRERLKKMQGIIEEGKTKIVENGIEDEDIEDLENEVEEEGEEGEYEEEYEDETDIREKVFCHWDASVENDEDQHSDESGGPLQLTCTFDEVVTQGIYPREDFVLVNSGVYIEESFYLWDYFERLEERFKQKPPNKARWVFDWKGPSS